MLRGRRGTEWATDAHGIQERFVLIDPNALQPIELPLEALGASVDVKANGLADDHAPAVQRTVSGEALRPPGPVDLRAERLADGTLDLTWIRRSRAGWSWIDGIDAPLGESFELYRTRIQGSDGSLIVETSEPRMTLTATQVSALGTGPLTAAVAQVGDFTESRPATLVI